MKGNGKWVLTSIVRNVVPKSPIGLQLLSTQVCVALPHECSLENSWILLKQESQTHPDDTLRSCRVWSLTGKVLLMLGALLFLSVLAHSSGNVPSARIKPLHLLRM